MPMVRVSNGGRSSAILAITNYRLESTGNAYRLIMYYADKENKANSQYDFTTTSQLTGTKNLSFCNVTYSGYVVNVTPTTGVAVAYKLDGSSSPVNISKNTSFNIGTFTPYIIEFM